jgi:transposase
LVAAGETVLDVPPTLFARVRLLDNARVDKTDAHDARSAAVVALRHSRLRLVGLEDHSAVLRLLAKRSGPAAARLSAQRGRMCIGFRYR